MGAPVGHPFFGNQHTDGGYILGSFTYEVIEKGVNVVKSVVSEAGKSAAKKPVNLAAKQPNPKNLSLSAVEKVSSKGLNKNHLIVAGILTVVTVGGFLVYRYINKKSKTKKEALQSIELSVGSCIKCGESLIESAYVSGNEANDYKDSYIVCKSCNEKNFARYPDEKDLLGEESCYNG